MDSALRNFEKRQKAVRKKHVRMARGYRNKMDRSGIIIQKPDSKIGGYAIRLLVITVMAFMAFKILLLAGLGEAQYLERVEALKSGNVYEQYGAWFMQIDPVTGLAAEKLVPLLNK